MNQKRLNAFMEVAQMENLHKAAESLEVTAAALSKLIAGLEKEWDLKLFDRTNRGLTLTPAGASMYRDVAYITQYFQESLIRAKEEKNKEKRIIRIGTSSLGGGKKIVGLLTRIQEEAPEFIFEFASFEVKKKELQQLFTHLGENIDLIWGIYDCFLTKKYPCQAKVIFQEELVCAVPFRNPLSRKDKLSMPDLRGETCWMMKGEPEGAMSQIKKDLMCHEPDIRLKEFSFYDVDVYNKCENDGSILFSLKHWKSLNPLMKIIPVEWNYRIPVSIFYSDNPSIDVLEFLKRL